MRACQHQVLAECHPQPHLTLTHTHSRLTHLTPPGPRHANTAGFLPLNFSRSEDEERLPFIELFFFLLFSWASVKDLSTLKSFADWSKDSCRVHLQANMDMQRHRLQLCAGNMKCGNQKIRDAMLQLLCHKLPHSHIGKNIQLKSLYVAPASTGWILVVHLTQINFL